jgi:hypothetical protein
MYWGSSLGSSARVSTQIVLPAGRLEAAGWCLGVLFTLHITASGTFRIKKASIGLPTVGAEAPVM